MRSTHRDDISFIDWLATQITRGEDSDLGAAFEENEDTWIEQFLELREILSHLCVPLSMQLDNRGMAQMELADMNLSWRKGWMSSYSYAVMNNPFGKLSVLRGLDNCALFCFMLAMWQVPGIFITNQQQYLAAKSLMIQATCLPGTRSLIYKRISNPASSRATISYHKTPNMSSSAPAMSVRNPCPPPTSHMPLCPCGRKRVGGGMKRVREQE